MQAPQRGAAGQQGAGAAESGGSDEDRRPGGRVRHADIAGSLHTSPHCQGAPPQALAALERYGFAVDPGGIRAMGLKREN